MWNLPEPVTEPEYPALAGGFLFTALPGKLQVLVVAQGIFSGGMRTLSCNMWDLVSQPGIHPRPLHWECKVVPVDHQGRPKTLVCLSISRLRGWYLMMP